MGAYIHPDDYNKVFDSKYNLRELVEYAYRGALLLKRERMAIDNHHASKNCNGDNLEPAFFTEPKIEEVEETQRRIESGNKICSYNKFSGSDSSARDTMFTTNNPNSQKRFENMGSSEMINSLEGSFQNKRKRIESSLEDAFEKKQKRIESEAIYNALVDHGKLATGNPVSPHVEKLIGFFESLQKLGSPISQELAIGIIIGTLPDEYDPFIKNFYGCGRFDMTFNELHEMLKSFEITIRKENPNNANLFVEKKKRKKKQAKEKWKGKENDQIKNLNESNPGSQPRRGPKCDDVCNHCKEFGHWKRNCKKYMEDRKKTRSQSTSVIL